MVAIEPQDVTYTVFGVVRLLRKTTYKTTRQLAPRSLAVKRQYDHLVKNLGSVKAKGVKLMVILYQTK